LLSALDLVIVVTSAWRSARAQGSGVIDVFINQAFPAVRH
jgi:hypothetical protein